MTTDASSKCQWCGLIHGPICWIVKAVEFFESGQLKRVEFKGAAEYSQLSSRSQSSAESNNCEQDEGA